MVNPSYLSDPRELTAVLQRRKWFLVVPLVLVLFAGLVASIVIAPKYESYVVMSVGSPVMLSDAMERMLGEFRSIIGVNDARSTDLKALKADILAAPFVARIVDEAKLADDPELLSEAQKQASMYPDMSLDQVVVHILSQELNKTITLEYITRSHLRMTVRAQDAGRARLLAATIGQVMVEEKERETQQTIFNSLNFSYDQLKRYEGLLQEKVDQKTRIDQQISNLESNEKNSSADIRKNARSEIQRRQIELSDLKSERRTQEASLEKLATSNLNVTESHRIMQERAHLDSLLKSAEVALIQGTGGDAEWSSIQIRIAESEDAISLEHHRLIAEQHPELSKEWGDKLELLLGTRIRIAYLEKFVDDLQRGLSDLDTRWVNLPALRARQDSLAQEIASAQELRNRLKDQQQTFEISEALAQHSSYKIVEEARQQMAPVWPNRPLIVVCALLAGLAIGFGAVIAVEISDLTLSSAQAVEAYLKLPVVGILPRIESTSKEVSRAG